MYKVQFVGAVCFFRQNGGRIALLPDGRDITPRHLGRIVVDPNRVVRTTNWPPRGRVERNIGEFRLPPCTVSLSGVDQQGTLDTTNHENRMPRLQAIQPLFRINPATADTIATVPIRQGKLEAFRYPRTPNVPEASIISQLDVPHDGEITITVTPRDGSEARTIVLRRGTEVAIANDTPDDEQSADHFHIYEKLDSNIPHPPLGRTPLNPAGLFIPVSSSEHRIFDGAIDEDLQCPNTGCCP